MKTKILSLVVVLSLVLSLGVAIPASAATTAGTEAPTITTAVETETIVYDEAYVALTGNDKTGTGTPGNPWRTITKAVNELPYVATDVAPMQPPYEGGFGDQQYGTTKPDTPSPKPDRINVYPSGGETLWYGGCGTIGIGVNKHSISENIVINYPVVLRSFRYEADGSEDTSGTPASSYNTKIDISYQNPNPPYNGCGWNPVAVIEIYSDDVTVIGLFVTGHSTGIYALGPSCDMPIHNVCILDCHVKVDEFPNGTGIEMENVKYPCIVNCDIDVGTEGADAFNWPNMLSVDMAAGIAMLCCYEASIFYNDIDVHGTLEAIGIYMVNCPSSNVDWEVLCASVYMNTIDVLAAGDCLGVGIRVYDSPLIKIIANVVTVKVNGQTFAIGFGIKVSSSNRSLTLFNTVSLLVNGVNEELGFLWGTGVWLKNSSESKVNANSVNVTGIGLFNSNGFTLVLPPNCLTDLEADISELNDIISTLCCWEISPTLGGAVVTGIKVTECVPSSLNQVIGNTVNVRLAADFLAGGSPDDVVGVGALALALGIIGFNSDMLVVKDNYVWVDKPLPDEPYQADHRANELEDVMTNVYVERVDIMTEDINAGIGLGLVLALGIGLYDCDYGLVVDNYVGANAPMYVYVLNDDYQEVVAPSIGENAIDLLDSQIFAGVIQSYLGSVESEAIDAQVDGVILGPSAIALNGAITAGLAVLVICSDEPAITGNTALGEANLEGETYSRQVSEEVLPKDAIALEGGVALGGGIAAILSPGATINENVEVRGEAITAMEIYALHEPAPPVSGTTAIAFGGGAGLAYGILVVGFPGADLTWEEYPEGVEGMCKPPCDGTEIVGNLDVKAYGTADPVCVHADDQIPDHFAWATAFSLGMAVGIGTLWTPCVLIQGNCVEAEGYAEACALAESLDTFDPLSLGGAVGIGVGIGVFDCFGANIIGNSAKGQGEAKGFMMAVEYPVPPPPQTDAESSNAFGGSLGLGGGILVFASPGSLVKGNSTICGEDCSPGAVGVGDAVTIVWAFNFVPLDEAHTAGLAIGIGTGIAVICSPCTDVIECNAAAGAGSARVCDWALADFDYEGLKIGVAASIDILVAMFSNTIFSEEEFDAVAEHWKWSCGKVNYNSMVDVDPLSFSGCGVYEIDAGLLKLGWPCLDAKFNYWNSYLGPSGEGPGNGEAVEWCGKPVKFVPWLYVEHCKVLEDQTGYFGFYYDVCKGVNAISTPIELSNGKDYNGQPILTGDAGTIPSSENWGVILENSGIALTDIKFAVGWDASSQMWELLESTDKLEPLNAYYVYFKNDCEKLIMLVNADGTSMPTKQLYTGWNLVGPNPLFGVDEMPADDVLVSVAQTTTGTPGYSQVVSPIVSCQHAWYYVQGMKCAPDMLSGRGYWVYMLNPALLVGFGFSPLPDQLGYIYYGYHY